MKAPAELVAGIRTFGLAGLFGGLAAVSVTHLGAFARVAIFIVLGLLVIAGYLIDARRSGDHGMTTEVALLLTFLLGSLAIAESRQLAAACAIVVALLLSLKTRLHRALKRPQRSRTGRRVEDAVHLGGAIAGAAQSGLRPGGAQPLHHLDDGGADRRHWLRRLRGHPRFRCAPWAAGDGAARRHRFVHRDDHHPGPTECATAARCTGGRPAGDLGADVPARAAGVGIVNPALLPGLSLPLAAAGAIYAAGALFYYLRAASAADSDAEPLLKNPFELGPALRFAALLVLILLLVEGARRWFGDAGIYLVSLLAA